jgi:glyoxylase-like metal-dependent hydrolase (beta-lactamase superfamily II)
MIQQITDNVIKISFEEFGSNCYLIDKKILIDTGAIENRAELIHDFQENALNFDDVKIILLTHLHWDHIGNLSLFKKARTYCSEEEIIVFKKNKHYFIRKQDLGWLEELETIHFFDIKIFEHEEKQRFKIIYLPGHTSGSIAIYMPKQKILFSGDTLFNREGTAIGRTDLKNSQADKMNESVEKLLKLKFKILCPGHF